MTSSLVGSEMCIRDRTKAGPLQVSFSQRSTIRDGAKACTGRRMSRCAPVSYTHLTLPTICSV
eukprot:408808-Prorocentrum_lima.AAC.1